MEFKHTPAPWIIIDGDDYFNITAKSTESSPNYMPLLDSDSIGMIEMRANADLIAAAPELLEALQSIQQSMAKYIEVANNIGVEATADGFYLGHAIDVEEKAKAAIAKALGQQ
ncbi:hypothetical protein JFB93_06200 [Providencia rettgeri]|uniref:hypothetical protein n=1 Tax=Providencia rettgeri TaxID=587 RepID=UPI0018E7F026|nr:hypothetical protein [Providencia rettgeri]QQE94423.1 hypothetical protein JFB93_06200 [Providencia rettgeri]QWJ92888.1 hypothetical protein KM147_06245 [Providencia rettgeri]